MLNTKLFDHTILKADATQAQVAKICDEALAHDFASVCVNQYYTKFVAEKLKGSDVKVCNVVGFPLFCLHCNKMLPKIQGKQRPRRTGNSLLSTNDIFIF